MLPPPKSLNQEHVAGARLFADRNKLIASLTPLQGAKCAEIGVAYGDFSQIIIDALKPSLFDAYDIFTFQDTPQLAERLSGKTHVNFYADRFRPHIEAGSMNIIVGDSSEELSKKPDEFYDMIYIDGDHSYAGVSKDTKVAVKKLRSNGILIFNDYKMYDHLSNIPYGIVHVVNDLCIADGWRITHFALQNQMYCDVALQRR